MMSQCPECGSSEIIHNLDVFTDEATSGQQPAYVKLVEPEPAKRPFVWLAAEVTTSFRASICGACGHTQLHAVNHAGLLEAHRKGYTSRP